MAKLILMRHGQSAWNERNLFTGWVDIPLSEKGIQESIEGGKEIRSIPIDLIFTSTLIRSHMTLAVAMLQHESGKIPVFQHPGQGKLEEWGGMWVVEKIRWTCFVYASPSLCFLCSNSQSHTRTHTHTSDILDISYNNHFLYSFHFHCLSHARTC